LAAWENGVLSVAPERRKKQKSEIGCLRAPSL